MMDKRKQIIADMEQYAQEHQVPIIDGESLQFLIDLFKEQKVSSILEIGTAIAYSTIQFADQLGASVVSVERDEERYQEAQKNVELAELTQAISLHFADALEWDIAADYPNQQFDALFIDAAKGKNLQMFEKFVPYAKKIIITDNVLYHGLVETTEHIRNRRTRQMIQKIRKYNEWILQHPDYTSHLERVGDGLIITLRKDEMHV
ncbi:MAG: O-methyltransferase [Culicoidibacterales bacterium]